MVPMIHKFVYLWDPKSKLEFLCFLLIYQTDIMLKMIRINEKYQELESNFGESNNCIKCRCHLRVLIGDVKT
jgi:hypothetical protein